jgi:hypothetical protein
MTMKKIILKIITAIILFSSLFITCKKSSHVKTRTELLTQKTWKFSSATVNGMDASSNLQACQKDNIYTFVSAGTGNVDEGPSKCNSGDPQTISFTWNFTTNETVLHISTSFFSGGSNDFTIMTLSETQLVVTMPYTPPVGPTLNLVVTFVH